MGVIERDPYTGHGTTGHEWNGIKELNTAVPWPIWAFLIGSVIFSVVWWILMPAWPIGTTYTKGLLGDDVRKDVAAHLQAAKEERSVWMNRIEKEDFAAIQADPALMENVRETGHALFGDNCAACHGVKAAGGPGFPDLVDKAWLWGGEPDTIAETIRIGINATNDETRVSQMMAFGRDGVLDDRQVRAVAAYVRSLSDLPMGASDKALVEDGKQVFADNCVACHGEDGHGSTDVGAPNLTDATWIYGSDAQTVYTTIYSGRQGHMPHWEGRLSPVDIKILALYVGTLGEAAR